MSIKELSAEFERRFQNASSNPSIAVLVVPKEIAGEVNKKLHELSKADEKVIEYAESLISSGEGRTMMDHELWRLAYNYLQITGKI